MLQRWIGIMLKIQCKLSKAVHQLAPSTVLPLLPAELNLQISNDGNISRGQSRGPQMVRRLSFQGSWRHYLGIGGAELVQEYARDGRRDHRLNNTINQPFQRTLVTQTCRATQREIAILMV
jgi:hypothetical protein